MARQAKDEPKSDSKRMSFSNWLKSNHRELAQSLQTYKTLDQAGRKDWWKQKRTGLKNEFEYNMDTYVREPSEDRGQLFKIEKVSSSWFVLLPLSVLAFLLCFWLVNWVLNVLMNLGTRLPLAAEGLMKMSAVFGIGQAFRLDHNFGLTLLEFLIALIVQLHFIWNIRTNYKDTNIGQKGTARWTTVREIQQQYKCIPEKAPHIPGKPEEDFYNGKGGVPICEYQDKIYIDDSPVNNLIIGITRSGKGEMFVFPMIDIYSRAGKDNPWNRASIIATDPKLELYANSFDTLRERGYEVCCLNLVNPLKSMGYNPLQMIIDAYKAENYDEAEMLANTFAYSIFNPGAAGGNDKFWSTESANLLVALILAHIDDCLKEDQFYNVGKLEEFRDLQQAWDDLDDKGRDEVWAEIHAAGQRAEEARDYWKRRIEKDPHINANKPEEAYREAVREFALNGIYELDAIPPEMEFTPSDKYERMITMYSIVNTFTELGRLTNSEDGSSALDDYFAVRPVGDRGKLKYSAIEVAGDQTKGSIFASCLAELTIFTYNDIAKMTSRTEFDLADVGFGDKPMAIFLGIPDYDQSNHFIASVFIRQLYFILAKRATQAGGKCKREVIFLLDEFGNLPAIEGMASIITVCLGRNIRFDLVIQSYAQVEKLYDKDADTIIGNCGNKIYILTNDNQTAENYSQSLGNKTITTISRSGGKLSQNKSFTESQEERPLLNPNELMQLKQGECVVTRTMKRTDNQRKNVAPTPIFNHGDTKFKYRYQYLAQDFTDGKTVDDIAYDQTVENTRMEEITFDIYHFCEDVMKVYIPPTKKLPGKDEEQDNPEYQKFLNHVKDSGGVEYTKRHDPEVLKKKKVSYLTTRQIRRVHEIMKPYVQGMQDTDPLFRSYSFYDCLWKTYLAYRNGTISGHDEGADTDGSSSSPTHSEPRTDQALFQEKFDQLTRIFQGADFEEQQSYLDILHDAAQWSEARNRQSVEELFTSSAEPVSESSPASST